MSQILLRIDSSFHNAIKQAAEKDGRSVNNYITKLIKEFMRQKQLTPE